MFLKDFIYLFLWRGEGRERGRETSMCGCLSCAPYCRDLARDPGTCPDWELNQWPFGLQASAQSTELHQPGLYYKIFKKSNLIQVKYYWKSLIYPPWFSLLYWDMALVESEYLKVHWTISERSRCWDYASELIKENPCSYIGREIKWMVYQIMVSSEKEKTMGRGGKVARSRKNSTSTKVWILALKLGKVLYQNWF